MASAQRLDLVGQRSSAWPRSALVDLLLDRLEVGQGQLESRRRAGARADRTGPARRRRRTPAARTRWRRPRGCAPRNLLPRPSPLLAPSTSPPMSTNCTAAWTTFWLLDISASRSSRSSGTLATPTFGSLVANAYGAARAPPPASALYSEDLPALGSPTNPNRSIGPTIRANPSCQVVPALVARLRDAEPCRSPHSSRRVGSVRGRPIARVWRSPGRRTIGTAPRIPDRAAGLESLDHGCLLWEWSVGSLPRRRVGRRPPGIWVWIVSFVDLGVVSAGLRNCRRPDRAGPGLRARVLARARLFALEGGGGRVPCRGSAGAAGDLGGDRLVRDLGGVSAGLRNCGRPDPGSLSAEGVEAGAGEAGEVVVGEERS